MASLAVNTERKYHILTKERSY